VPLSNGQNQIIVMQAADSYRQARQFDKALEFYQLHTQVLLPACAGLPSARAGREMDSAKTSARR
jgi:hypothetical protein